MTKPYFRQVPNFQYVDRSPGDQAISNYIEVKNLFKKAKLRDDIFSDLSFFTKYSILGDERPDNVAYKFYNDSTLDWIILLSNNVINVQTEWPLSQQGFYNYLIDKYGSEEVFNEVHHYETIQVNNTDGAIIVRAGLKVPSDYSISYFDINNGQTMNYRNITVEVSNYDYEEKIQNDKRNIFVLKPNYLNLIFNDLEDIMPYKKGSTQYVNATLKKGDNIRLFQ
jgi:hypothetical protein